MKKALIYIIVFLFPLTITTMFIRKANNVEEFGSFNLVYNYLQMYPVETVDDIKDMFVNWKDILFTNADFSPDWSGSIWSDIAEIGELIAEAFTFLYNIIRWQVLFFIDILMFFWDSLSWILNFPYYVLNG